MSDSGKQVSDVPEQMIDGPVLVIIVTGIDPAEVFIESQVAIIKFQVEVAAAFVVFAYTLRRLRLGIVVGR